MTIKILIDSREKALIQVFQMKDIHFETGNLDIGDIHLIYEWNDNKYETILERKTINDLLASIKDGRYKEQKIRLMSYRQENSNCSIHYILEEQIPNNHLKSTVLGSIINSMLRDNISIFKTSNIMDTYEYIEKMIKNLPDCIQDRIKSINEPIKYVECVKSKKKENITPENFFYHLLMTIPGVSATIAQSLVQQYPDLYSLFVEYQSLDNEDEKMNYLGDHKVNQKRIGKLSNTIYQYLSALFGDAI